MATNVVCCYRFAIEHTCEKGERLKTQPVYSKLVLNRVSVSFIVSVVPTTAQLNVNPKSAMYDDLYPPSYDDSG